MHLNTLFFFSIVVYYLHQLKKKHERWMNRRVRYTVINKYNNTIYLPIQLIYNY